MVTNNHWIRIGIIVFFVIVYISYASELPSVRRMAEAKMTWVMFMIGWPVLLIAILMVFKK